ncbi:MAG: DUF6056 family protein [Anaerolineaceae bacterium]|nr:DUF6056 family protein [Anaerolineaceae bacterium]
MNIDLDLLRKKHILFFSIMVLLILTFFIAIMMHGYIGSFSRYIADDYCTSGKLATLGFWPAQSFWYNNWTGRVSFTFFVSIFELFDSNIIKYLPTIFIFMILISGYFLFYSIIKNFQIINRRILSLLISVGIIFTTFFTLPNIGQNLYWMTGAVTYLFPINFVFFLFGLIILFRKKFPFQHWIANLLVGLFIFFLAFVGSGFSEVLSVLQIVLLCMIILVLSIKQRFLSIKNLWMVALIGSIIGLVIMVSAPGNEIRLRQLLPNQGLLIFLYNSFRYFFKYLVLWFVKNINIIWPISSLLILMTYFVRKHFYFGKEILFNQVIKFSFMIISGLLILIFVCFLPSTWVTAQAPETRVLIFPTFLLVFLINFVSIIIGLFFIEIVTINENHKKTLSLIIGFYILYFLVAVPIFEARQVYLQRPEAVKYAISWEEREFQIKEKILSGETDLIVMMIPINILGLEDINTNSTHWINICAAEYYGVDSISAE